MIGHSEHQCYRFRWEVVAVYQDDGYTGLNMERPDLKRMLKAIERRQVNLVVTKDLSRLGRNYLQTGFLIEDFFPRHGVRYIAMNDGIDTMRDNNDIAPFKNILNEMYSKDISKKVHSSYVLKAQKGQFTGCVAPFGYKKDPEDKNHLLIDEETAPIVRRLFAWALEGHGPNYIPVSYTHLEAACLLRERGAHRRAAFLSSQRACGDQHSGDVHGHPPVSYTHLDVYKRQLGRNGRTGFVPEPPCWKATFPTRQRSRMNRSVCF